MNSKDLAEEAPPPYAAYESDSDHGRSQPSLHLQRHLTSLPGRIRRACEARSMQQAIIDASLLEQLVPEISTFLSDVDSLVVNVLDTAYLYLVPASVIPPGAQLSHMDEMRQKKRFCRVVRVKTDTAESVESVREKGEWGRDSKSASTREQTSSDGQTWAIGQEFSDWGRFDDSSAMTNDQERALWWADEDMARRLARCLQPDPSTEPPPALDTVVQTIAEERLPPQKEKKGWFRGFRAGGSSSSSTSTYATKTVEKDVRVARPEAGSRGEGSKSRWHKAEDVQMLVTAEEVAFRTQNDFGILESKSGWALVVVLRVPRGFSG
ncbi:hypothetical protein GGS20DRAFT_124872 [Poronia punctata]|nr:hypothetical protein GGS20DRAFT_124872 [Poronia punctata]